ncbi:MAG TPA: hypothetical protein PK954_15845 [Anaerolineales bacterium]|nr:hypothetical protein [Anaerolineales bacterium]
MDLLPKALVIVGSMASIGFGVWHFFVPEIWRWNAYIDADATELAVAVRAINVFFSLSLVLFGGINILLSHGDRSNRYSLIVVLAAGVVEIIGLRSDTISTQLYGGRATCRKPLSGSSSLALATCNLTGSRPWSTPTMPHR